MGKKKKKPKLTKKKIEELLERGAKGAAELDKDLKRVFRLPDRPLRLD